ncbi:MAG: COG3014 family protein [Pseudobdellovibrionaceae bacterium]
MGQFKEAAEQLKPLAEKQSDDQLIYLLDYAMALHLAGEYQESNRALLMADKLSEMQDYHSISNIAGSLIVSEEMLQYHGEDFERMMINAYLAINFLMMGDLDSARVEARRMNEKLSKFREDGDKEFADSPFATYLSALIWEAGRNYDDAYIDYEATYKLAPNYAPLREDLIRSAGNAKRYESKEQWQSRFREVKEKASWKSKVYGELIVIYEQGWGPRKEPMPDSPRFPKLYSTYNQTQQLQVEVKREGTFKTDTIYNVEQVAIRSLDSKYGKLAAKKIGALATKAVVADQIRQKYGALGDVAWIAMNVSDRADLRHWSTLPQTLQIVRIPLPEGKYTINLQGLSSSGAQTNDSKSDIEVHIKGGQKTFYNWRSLR